MNIKINTCNNRDSEYLIHDWVGMESLNTCTNHSGSLFSILTASPAKMRIFSFWGGPEVPLERFSQITLL